MQYETEEQQVEAIKEWWKENGVSVVSGIVIGLLAVFGWRAWISHQDMIGAEASAVFDQLVTSVAENKPDVAKQQAVILRDEYASTPYSAFAELMEARQLYERADTAGAEAALRRAIEKAPNEAFKAIAVLRLARMLLSTSNLSGATVILNQYPAPPAFAAEQAAIRGDIAAARGDVIEARRAYQEALAGKIGNADLIQLKLDNLPPTP